jgi:tetratricopeptide (TPR) repeat protein
MTHLPRLLLALAIPLAVPLAGRAALQENAQAELLDRLFKALRAAPDEATASHIEERIRGLWAEKISPAAALLLQRGDRDLHNDAGGEAVADYDALLDLEPDFAEGYTRRAAARAASGDYFGAIRDIEEALKRDPRDFPALQGLSHIAEQQGNWRGALEAWQKALDIDPRTPGGIERLELLQKKVEGEAT